jgi:hypothetical protein
MALLSKSMILLCLRHAARTRRDAPGAESKSLRDGIFDFHTSIHQRRVFIYAFVDAIAKRERRYL